MKRFLALVLAMIMVFAMSTSVFAQTVDTAAGGAGTITITNASKSQTYGIFKLFDATVNTDGNISYKLMSGKTDLGTGTTWFNVDAAGNVLANVGADVSSDAFKTWAEGYGVQVGSTITASDSTVIFTGVPYGYYYVASGLGGTLTVDSTNPTASVIDKNTTNPNVPTDGGKKIVTSTTSGGTTTTALTNSNTAKIGDVVNYQITFNATNFETNNKVTTAITEYTVEDTPSALDIDTATIVVKVKEATLAASAYTVAKDNGKVTITIPWQTDNEDGTYTAKYDSPSLVTITYSATVTKEATDNASNAAKVKYNSKELNGGSTDTETYYFDLVKDNDKKEVLEGAEFKLYDAATGGNEIPVVEDADGVYRVAVSGETGVAIEAGKARILGLDGTKTYYLEETKAPEGYNILTSRIAVNMESNKDNGATVEEKDGKKIYKEGGVEIINQRGAELPSTGGIGTTIFYVIGAILVIGAGILLVTRRRMSSK